MAEFTELKCLKCGSDLLVFTDRSTIECGSCGANFLIPDGLLEGAGRERRIESEPNVTDTRIKNINETENEKIVPPLETVYKNANVTAGDLFGLILVALIVNDILLIIFFIVYEKIAGYSFFSPKYW